MYAMLSISCDNCSCGMTFSWGTCCVRHNNGPRAQRSESSSTEKLPETAICPYKQNQDFIST